MSDFTYRLVIRRLQTEIEKGLCDVVTFPQSMFDVMLDARNDKILHGLGRLFEVNQLERDSVKLLLINW